MKKIFFLSALLLISSSLHAQYTLLDSLKNELNTTRNDSIKMYLLTELCYQYINIDSAEAKVYLDRMLKNAETTKYTFEKAEALRIAANYYSAFTDYERALDYYKKAEQVYLSLKNTKGEIGYAKVKVSSGAIFYFYGDFKTALAHYFEAEYYFYKHKDYDTLLRTYTYISEIYEKNDGYDKVKAYDNKMKAVLDSVSNPLVKCDYYNTHASLMIHEKKYGEAEECYKNALKISEPAKFYNILAIIENSYGHLLLLQNKYYPALMEFIKSAQYAHTASLKYEEALAWYGVGLTYLKTKMYYNSNKSFLNAFKHAEEIKSKLLMRDILKSLAEQENARGNFKLAYNYLQRYMDLSNRIYSEEDRKQTNFLNAKFEAAKNENKIKQLTNEKRIQTLEIDQRKNLIYTLLVVIILLLITFFFIQKNYKNKKKINEQNLLIREQKIRELENEKQIAAIQYALEGEEKERARLARDLHDGLGGLLSGAKMSFGSYKENFVHNGEQTDSFKHAFDLLNKSIIELQRVAHNMMPQALINGNLKDAVSEFCEKIDASTPLSVKFRFFGKEQKIDHNYEITIYRIVQELVNNIIKHSDAKEALVQLVQEENRIGITVQDNGKGFDVSSLEFSRGHGLKNIRLRVESLNGHFEVVSSPGKGTEASIEFENLRS